MKQCKPKKCKECQKYFPPVNSLQNVCGWKCALERVNRINNQKATLASKKEESLRKREIRARKQALKSKSDHLREAQRDCNAFIRESDTSGLCISCKRVPKKRNAGHYKSIGAFPELRFHPFNIHLQCEHCNSYKSGNISEYRPNLIKKIGTSNVEWLEGSHKAQNLTIDDIKEIKQYYREQLKYLTQS